MTIVRCPRCRDEVSVPAKATPRALVRCPLCLEQYLLAEALANAPPPLIIIGGEVAQEAIHQPATGEDEYRLSGGGVLDATSPAAATVVMPRPAVRGTQRTRRPQGSGIILLANYVIGGVLGLAMGLLVLWWGFRRDPLELGPPIAKYAPWIVPESFRTAPRSDSASEAASKSTIPSSERRTTAKTKATAESTESSELQTLPGLDEPGRLPAGSTSPAIEAPNVRERGANERKGEASQASATTTDEAKTAPPMPDLRDLLP